MPWLRVYVASVVATTAMASDGSGSSVLADNASFVFDGTTSDIAQQLYRRFQDNDEIAQLSLNEVPDMVAQRLSAAGVAFEDLPGTLQRAVLWDSGFVISPNHDALQLWTLDGRAITDLAVSYDEFLEQGCTAMNCSQPNNEMYHSNQFCDGDQMLGAARCVIEEFTDGTQAYLAMWSNGGDTNMIPEIRAIEHSWQDTYNNKSYVVYAVHTHDEVTEPAYATCPSNGYGSLVLPCYPNTNLTASVKAKMTEVEPSQWVTEWLEQYQSDSSSSDDSGFDMVLLIPIILVPLIIILLVIFCCLRRRQLKREKASNSQTRSDFDKVNSNLGQDPYKDDFHSPDPNMPGGAYSDVTRPTDSTEDTTTTWGPDQTIPFPRAYPSEDDNSSGSNRLIYVLQNDPNLAHNRIPFEQIHFQTMLSKGAFGEVWMSELQGQQVAVKRLLQSKQSKFDDIQAFTDEIQLSASLKHPNVVQFVGVAWNTLYNLVMVVEYLPMGDLQTFLKKQGDLMTWARDKVHIAIGIARALDYLHNREPALIHRDIKSKNVLLTRDLEPQLIDFGVSRRRVEATMTAGVGTPYWTAPEVLDGQRYTEQSDIYSFGVLLSEIDSGKLPYHDAVGPQGEKLKPFQILNDVMGGVLRPSFSEDCPPRIRRIGVACLQQDATRRPKARDLVHLLGG